MRKNENTENIEGKIYQFDLKEKVTGENSKNPGTPYIAGTVEVAIDAEASNIVPVHYTYVAPTYSSGKPNNTYTALKQIITSGKTVVTDGYDMATCVKLNPSYSVNDWYPQGQETVQTTPRNEGGFVNIVTPDTLRPEGDVGRHKFSVDVIIFEVTEITPDEGDSYVQIKGITFDFRNAALPITMVARNAAAAKYFLDLEASKKNPVYTKVWGKIVNVYTVTEKTVESAFGDAEVEKVTRRSREYVITHANPVPYEFDSSETITKDELNKALQDRQVYLAAEKKRVEDYRASQGASNASPATQAANAVPKGSFNW